MSTRALIKTSGVNTKTATPISSRSYTVDGEPTEALVVVPTPTAGQAAGRAKYEMSGGLPVYMGTNEDPAAANDANNWQITKFTWSGEDLEDKQTLQGSWANRASLGWV